MFRLGLGKFSVLSLTQSIKRGMRDYVFVFKTTTLIIHAGFWKIKSQWGVSRKWEACSWSCAWGLGNRKSLGRRGKKLNKSENVSSIPSSINTINFFSLEISGTDDSSDWKSNGIDSSKPPTLAPRQIRLPSKLQKRWRPPQPLSINILTFFFSARQQAPSREYLPAQPGAVSRPRPFQKPQTPQPNRRPQATYPGTQPPPVIRPQPTHGSPSPTPQNLNPQGPYPQPQDQPKREPYPAPGPSPTPGFNYETSTT